ncbi:MAG: hypothetical protein ACK4S3_06445, partial [Parvibaculum sp.]
PGTGTSDSILARVSAGEFVVNAKSTAKHLPVLEAINKGGLPGFAAGGRIGDVPVPSIPALPAHGFGTRSYGGVTVSPTINATVNATGGDPKQNADLANQIGSQLEGVMRSVVMDELTKAVRPNGFLEARSR